MNKQNSTCSEDKEWDIKTKYDDDIKLAIVELTPYGDVACRRFRDIYKVINDKSKILSIVADLKIEFER